MVSLKYVKEEIQNVIVSLKYRKSIKSKIHKSNNEIY